MINRRKALIFAYWAVFMIHFGNFSTVSKAEESVKKSGRTPMTQLKAVGHSSSRMIMITSVVRLYRESILRKPNDLFLRQRFIDFLLKFDQERYALREMEVLFNRTPENGALGEQIENLRAKISSENEFP